jgi:hypothetical protein
LSGSREKAKGKRRKAKGKRRKAKGKRQKAKGKRQKAKGKKNKAILNSPFEGASPMIPPLKGARGMLKVRTQGWIIAGNKT